MGIKKPRSLRHLGFLGWHPNWMHNMVAEVELESPTRKYSRLGRVRVARFRCSLFSPLSRSLPLALRAVALQAHDLLRRP